MRKFFHNFSNALNVLVFLLFFAIGIYALWLNSNDLEREQARIAEEMKKVAEEIACLEKNIYHEAQHEPPEGKAAVAFVTVARTHRPDFPPTICGVVNQSREFSWTANQRLRDLDISGALALPRNAVIRYFARRYFGLQKDVAALRTIGAQLGLSLESLFYKRFDWNEHDPNERRMSEQNKWWWAECLEPVLDKMGQRLVIGAHAFYRDKAGPCPPYVPPAMPLPERNPRRIHPTP